ncbi:MAG: alpha/beta hydrolase, partial [Bacillota bacterium]|nr:alpha/beta hydrolase [Bacillota bacterium]
GAIALNAFGMLDEVDACIAMSPYASFEKQLDLLMKKYNIPAFIRKYELFISKRVLYFNYSKHIVSTMKPELQIQNAKGRPVAIIACSGDDSVPVENTYILKECADYADVWIRDSWEHFIVKDCNFKNVEEDTEYCDYIKQFIQKVVERQN